jgi:hypothetical protein
MRYLLVIFLLPACAGFQDYKSVDHFRALVIAENDQLPWITDDLEFFGRLMVCMEKKPETRGECNSDLIRWSRAKVNVSQEYADSSKALDLYTVQRDKLVSEMGDEYKKRYERKVSGPGKDYALNVILDLFIYEGMVRQLHENAKTANLYEQHVNAVAGYNEAVSRKREATAQILNSLSQVTSQINTDNKIRSLQNQNYNLQRQQNCQRVQDGYRQNGGIMPICN